MATVQLSRTLVKSVPELWAQLCGQPLLAAVDGARVECVELQRALSFETREVHGTAVLEPTSWGTKVTLTAEVDEAPARDGFVRRLFGRRKRTLAPAEVDRRLTELLDYLGQAHRRPSSLQSP